jgi:protein TonB
VRPQPPKAVPNPDVAPIEAPAGVRPEPETPPADFDRPDATAGGVIFGDAGGAGAIGRDELPPPPPVRATGPLRVGGIIHPPEKIVHVAPVYPGIARSAHVSGVVVLEATIGADGTVREVKVLRSIPLLDQAASDAVRQWRFTPTLLNGQPVPVLMTVTVSFQLD